MKIFQRAAMFFGLLTMLATSSAYLYGGKVLPCLKFASGTDSCNDGPFWDCTFPACYDFHIAGGDDGVQWDSFEPKFDPMEPGYRATTFQVVVCSCSGLCIIEALDPLDPENYTCYKQDSDDWNCHSKYQAILDINTPCY